MISGTSRQRSMALVLVLWTIAVLSLLAGGLAFTIRQDLAVSNIEKARLSAHHLARAGIERAIAEVMDDLAECDTIDDFWYDDPDSMSQVSLEGGTFDVIHGSYDPIPTVLYGAEDESAKLNLNVATQDELMKLPDMTTSIAAAMIDWRDSNEEPEPDGIERGYYQSLLHPYQIRNAPFRTVRELLLVRGVTDQLFYGEDMNTNGLLDPNENDGDANAPIDNADGRLDRGWQAYVTVYSYEKNVNGYGRRRLNINTASADDLSERMYLEEWAAQSIVRARERNRFNHLIDLLDVTVAEDVNRPPPSSDLNTRDDSEQDQPVTKAIFQRCVDDLTITNSTAVPGRVNLNTAPLVVIRTLPGLTDELAEAIVQYREGRTGGFDSIGRLLDITDVTKEIFARLENRVTVRSYVFRIRSEGTASSGMAKATIECVVDRGGDVPRVLYWAESSP